MNTQQLLLPIIIIGTFIIVLASVIGLIIVAVHNPSVLDAIIPVLSAVVTGFTTAAAAIVTNWVNGHQEQARIILNNDRTNTP